MYRINQAVIIALALPFALFAEHDWPQWRGPERDGVWRESGIGSELQTDSEGWIDLKWSVDIGAGYSQPTVADDRVYVTDRLDDREEIERVHCFDFKTGELLWSHQYPAEYTVGYKSGPRAAVLIDKAAKDAPRAYSLGGMGHLHCLDAKTGKVIWQRDLATEYNIEMPRWGIAASPLIEGDLLFLQIGGQPDACVIALDKHTGEERWRAIDDDASYVAPMMIEQANQRVLVVYTADELFGLNPDTGKAYWSFAMPGSQWPIGISTPVLTTYQGKRYLFTTNAHIGSALLLLHENKPEISKVWYKNDTRSPDNLHSLIPTPYIKDGYIYGTHQKGELRCLELLTGKLIWESTEAVEPDRFATLHMVAQGDAGETVWIFNEHGELIISELTPEGYHQHSRGKLVNRTAAGMPSRIGGVTWAHPAFAYKHVFVRNDEQLVCADLSAR